METDMTEYFPVVPVAAGALVRGLASVLAVVTYWLKAFGRAQRNRRVASQLAGLDRHMLADIGITRADVRDAFSEPFWEDPTALLKERAIERRINRAIVGGQRGAYPEYRVRHRALAGPARQAV
jgi:uncharacterized protein YjiS (DUF1127 family)